MSHKIESIEGIGQKYAQILRDNGIKTVEKLLEEGATKKGRAKIEEATKLDHSRVLKWVNMADLFRIKGVGEELSELLEASGVDTVKELKMRKPENLHQALVETNKQKKLVRQTPGLSQVESWVKQAKSLPAKVKY